MDIDILPHTASGGWGARNTAWPEWQGACRPYYHVTNAGPAPLSISAAIFPGSPGRAGVAVDIESPLLLPMTH